MNINFDVLISHIATFLMGILALVGFVLHTKMTSQTIQTLLKSVDALTDKVIARTLNEVTQKVAVQAQAEINKIAVSAAAKETATPGEKPEPLKEDEVVL